MKRKVFLVLWLMFLVSGLAKAEDLTANIVDINAEHQFVVIDLGTQNAIELYQEYSVIKDGQEIAIFKVIEVKQNHSACDVLRSSETIRIFDEVVLRDTHAQDEAEVVEEEVAEEEIEYIRRRKIEDALEQELSEIQERRIVKEPEAVIEQDAVWLVLAKKEADKRRKEAKQIAQKRAEKKGKPFAMSGKTSLRYENSWGNGTNDQKMTEYILLHVDNVASEHVSAYLHMRSEQDIDGGNGSDHSSARDRVYSAYMDFKELPLKLSLRGGRQYFPEVESVHFDGVRLNWSDVQKGSVSLFSGEPVTYYGKSYGDLLSGAVATFTPSRTSRFSAHYLNVRNDNSDDEGAGFSFYQRFGRAFNVIGRSTFLNEDPKDLSLRVRYNHYPSRISLNTTYYRQMLEIDTSSDEYSPYILSLGSFIPFHHISLNLNKSFNSWQLGTGVLIRRPLDSTDEAQRNLKFNKYFASLSMNDFLWKGLNPSLTFSHWDNPTSDRNTFSGIFTQEFGKQFEISLGTFFSNYYYNFYTGQERTQTRTYFFKIDYDIIKNWDISFDLSRQDSSNYDEPSYSSEIRINRRF